MITFAWGYPKIIFFLQKKKKRKIWTLLRIHFKIENKLNGRTQTVGVMVWGPIVRSPLLFIRGSMRSTVRHVDDILQSTLLPHLEGRLYALFQ